MRIVIVLALLAGSASAQQVIIDQDKASQHTKAINAYAGEKGGSAATGALALTTNRRASQLAGAISLLSAAGDNAAAVTTAINHQGGAGGIYRSRGAAVNVTNGKGLFLAFTLSIPGTPITSSIVGEILCPNALNFVISSLGYDADGNITENDFYRHPVTGVSMGAVGYAFAAGLAQKQEQVDNAEGQIDAMVAKSLIELSILSNDGITRCQRRPDDGAIITQTTFL